MWWMSVAGALASLLSGALGWSAALHVVERVALGSATPVVLSLDTTVWLAGTASLLLPVSNLTNLLAAGVDISWRSFLWRGAVLVPAVLVASAAALVV